MARIYGAFLHQRTWTQAALAREIEIGVAPLRKCLDELVVLGMPLEREEETPQVYWSVPSHWFPGGSFFPNEDLPDLLCVLWHIARGRRRERLLRRVLGAARDRADVTAAGAAIITPESSDADETWLPVIERAMARRKAVTMRFYSTERGAVETRHASVHRVDVGPPTRLIAICHRAGQLRWFRADNIVEARADESAVFRAATDEAIEAFRAESLDGFREADAPEEHVFFVRDPEATWVEKNLLPRMRATRADDGIRVTVHAAGALRVARYTVSLGDAATPETEHLARLVEQLARGALRNVTTPRKLAKTRETGTEPARRRANR